MRARRTLASIVAVCLALSGCDAGAGKSEPLSWQEARQQFVANQDVANKALHGKDVEWSATVSATAQRLEHASGLFAVLQPEAGNKSTSFIAWFPEEMHDEVFALRPGQQVRVRCRIDHMSTKFLEVAISLEACKLAWVTPLSSEEAAGERAPAQTINVPDRVAPR
jgi:hypothetical protein